MSFAVVGVNIATQMPQLPSWLTDSVRQRIHNIDPILILAWLPCKQILTNTNVFVKTAMLCFVFTSTYITSLCWDEQNLILSRCVKMHQYGFNNLSHDLSTNFHTLQSISNIQSTSPLFLVWLKGADFSLLIFTKDWFHLRQVCHSTHSDWGSIFCWKKPRTKAMFLQK